MDRPLIPFVEFKRQWEELRGFPQTGHKGSFLMRLVHRYWKEEYLRITSVHYYDETNIDCCFNEELIPNTLKHLEKVWTH
jgi:hypothetical protein